MARQWSDGHSSSILCVAACGGPDGLLASGSEGGEVTVWSQEGAVIGRLTLSDQEDTTGVVFSPVSSDLYVSHGEAVTMLDPRNLKGPVSEFRGVGEEEINALALNENGTALALVNDSGAVRVLELPAGKVSRTLRRHTNICSSVAFRPSRPNNLLSAGLDMQVMLWGLQKTRPLWTVNLQQALEEEEEEHQQRPGQLFNPPLAHCVSVTSCGNVLGCAAEDGRVHLMRIGSGSKIEQQGALKAHSQGASQAHFINFLSNPYWLATGGNDGRVLLWDLSQHPVVAPEGKSQQRVSSSHRRKVKNRVRNRDQPPRERARSTPSVQADQEEQEEEEHDDVAAAGAEEIKKSGPKMSIDHGDKVNWLCPAILRGQPSVVVADQSCSMTVYALSGI